MPAPVGRIARPAVFEDRRVPKRRSSPPRSGGRDARARPAPWRRRRVPPKLIVSMPELVAAVVGPGDRGQVVDVADRAHHDDGLVFGAFAFLVPAVRLDAGVALAADRAEEASAGPLEDGLGDRFARDVLEQVLVVEGVLEIPVGQHRMTLMSSTSPAVPSSRRRRLVTGRLPHEIERLIVAGLVALLVLDPDLFPARRRGSP